MAVPTTELDVCSQEIPVHQPGVGTGSGSVILLSGDEETVERAPLSHEEENLFSVPL